MAFGDEIAKMLDRTSNVHLATSYVKNNSMHIEGR